MKNTVWDRLQEVMQELGLGSSRELAEFCDVTEGLVSQWSKGDAKLGAKPLLALARTQFSLDWIVDGKLPKYSAERKHITVEKPGTNGNPISGDDAIEILTLFEAADEHQRILAKQTLKNSAEKNGVRWRRTRKDQS